MAGYLEGCDSWFNNPSARVSAHYGIDLQGEMHQYVALDDTAYANGKLEPGNYWPGPTGVNPNSISVSIETEDNANNATPVTDEMYYAVEHLCSDAIIKYSAIKYLVSHRAISPNSRANCPGERWKDNFYYLANELGLEAIW